LRLLPVRGIVELLRSLPVRARTTILAQAIHEGTMTRAGADQVLIAIVLKQNGLSVRWHAQQCACLDDKRSATSYSAIRTVRSRSPPRRGSNGCRQM
jgi:hypothetical protein